MAPAVGVQNLKKKSWRDYREEKKKRKGDRIVKKLEEKKKKCDEEKPVVEKPKKTKSNSGYLKTCSIAVPSSILDNAQSDELRSYLAGQIARAACIYRINEIIIFDDSKGPNASEETSKTCLQFARILQYVECPQYLRKHFFPIHKDLQYIGLVNPLDAPHHLRQSEDAEFREGITTNKKTKSGVGCYVNVGLERDIRILEHIEPGFRVTIRLEPVVSGQKKRYGIVVSPEEPVKVLKCYWGYTVRIAHSLTEVFTRSPYEKGYDLSIGTSDKGDEIENFNNSPPKNYKHALIVFGGVKGLELALDVDPEVNVDDPALLFDHYINTCPGQGSRTIRTEEAVLITLAELRNTILDKRWVSDGRGAPVYNVMGQRKVSEGLLKRFKRWLQMFKAFWLEN